MQEKLLQEQVTVHSELCVPAALSEDRQALKGSSVLRGVSPTSTQKSQPQHLGSTVPPSCCPALGWRNQGMVTDQVVLPFALRLTDVEDMVELKFFDGRWVSSHPFSVALAVFGRAEMMLQSWSSSLSTGEVQ